ncbi:MAG: ATP-binding protein [Bacteroidota bacterium]
MQALLKEPSLGVDQKAQLYNELTTLYMLKSLDSAEVYSRLAMELLGTDQTHPLYSATQLLDINLAVAQNQISEAEENMQLLLPIVVRSGDAGQLARCYNSLAVIKRRLGQLDSAQWYVFKALDISPLSKASEANASSFNILAKNYELFQQYDSSLHYYAEAIDIAKQVQSDPILAAALYNQAITFYKLGQDDAAIHSFIELIQLAEVIDASRILGRSHSVLASLYNLHGQRDSCLIHIQKGLQVADNGSIEEMYGYMALGQYHFEDNAFDQAWDAHSRALAIAEEIASLSKGDILLELGKIKMQTKDLQEALHKFEEGITFADSLGLQESIVKGQLLKAQALTDLGQARQALLALEPIFKVEEPTILLPAYHQKGQILQLQGQFQLAKKEYLQGLKIAKELDSQEKVSTSYYGLAYCDSVLGNTKEALHYMSLYASVEVQRQRERYRTSVAEFETKFETAEKENKIRNLEQEQKLANLEMKQRITERNRLLMILGILLLTAGIIVALYFRIRRQRAALDQANQTKDRIFSMIAHDLRGPITGFQALGKIFSHHLERKNLNPLQALSFELTKQSSQIKELLDNLLTWALQQLDVYQARPEPFHLHNLGTQVMAYFEQTAKAKQSELRIEVEEDMTMYGDRSGWMIVLTNLISNAVKFTEEGRITLRGDQQADSAIVEIEDTGTGMDEKQIQALQKGQSLSSQKGTKGESGTGLGWQVVHRLIEEWGGQLEIESQKGVGTSIRIRVPVMKE